jgi:hypothetical protein
MVVRGHDGGPRPAGEIAQIEINRTPRSVILGGGGLERRHA